jgi:hypothetical protein
MRSDQIEALVAAWLEFERTPENTPEWESRRSVVFQFDELCTSNPEAAWKAILAIVERESDEEILGTLAAGPLEDLLSRHGEALVERVEQQAHADAKFRSVLRGLYQLLMTDEVWQRVQAAGRESAV